MKKYSELEEYKICKIPLENRINIYKNMDHILVKTAIHDTSSLVRYGVIEALGLLQSAKCMDVFNHEIQDKNIIVQRICGYTDIIIFDIKCIFYDRLSMQY